MHLASTRRQKVRLAGRDHRVPRRRDHPHREQLQVHARAVRGAGARIRLVAGARRGPTRQHILRCSRWVSQRSRPGDTRFVTTGPRPGAPDSMRRAALERRLPRRSSVGWARGVRERLRMTLSWYTTQCRSAKPIRGGCNISAMPLARPDVRHPDRGFRCLGVVPAAALGLRQDRGRPRQGLAAAPHGMHAAGLSGVLQADHQPQGNGHRQPGHALGRRV